MLSIYSLGNVCWHDVLDDKQNQTTFKRINQFVTGFLRAVFIMTGNRTSAWKILSADNQPDSQLPQDSGRRRTCSGCRAPSKASWDTRALRVEGSSNSGRGSRGSTHTHSFTHIHTVIYITPEWNQRKKKKTTSDAHNCCKVLLECHAETGKRFLSSVEKPQAATTQPLPRRWPQSWPCHPTRQAGTGSGSSPKVKEEAETRKDGPKKPPGRNGRS